MFNRHNTYTNQARRFKPLMQRSLEVSLAGGSNWVINEDHTDDTDGAETNFSTTHEFAPGTLLAFLDGLLQRPGVGNDYTEDADFQGVTFTAAPANNSVLLFSYIREPGTNPDAGLGYIALVNSLNPIAFWPLNEIGGTNAHCEVNRSQDGVFTDVSLGAVDCPFGEIRAPSFNGTSSLVNVYSTALNTALKTAVNADAGTITMWVRIDEIADWIDNTVGTFINFRTDGSIEYLRVLKSAAAGCPAGCPSVAGAHRDGTFINMGAQVSLDDTIPTTPTDWTFCAYSWSNADTEMILYFGEDVTTEIDGADVTWTGDLSSTQSCIGAETTTPTNTFKGNLAYVAIFDRALTTTEIDSLKDYAP